LCQKTAVAQFM